VTAAGSRLEAEPGLDDAIVFARFPLQCPVARLYRWQCPLQHRANGVPALQRVQVPGERDQVAPVTIRLEQAAGRINVCSARLAENESGQVPAWVPAANNYSPFTPVVFTM